MSRMRILPGTMLSLPMTPHDRTTLHHDAEDRYVYTVELLASLAEQQAALERQMAQNAQTIAASRQRREGG